MLTFDEKVKQATQSLRLAAEMSEYYYHKPLVICYSGGKDSDIVLDLAKRCLQPNQFEVIHNHTTVDAPETVYYVRKVFRELHDLGIKATISLPTLNGERTSMWKIIEFKGMPPTRLTRYCCKYLKERTIPNRFICFGVREDEGNNRKNRDIFQKLGYDKRSNEFRSLQHTYAMFQLDKKHEYEVYTCKLIEACKENADMICNPIYSFTDEDVWKYIRQYQIEVNPLYAKGYKRVGCVGCPMAGAKRQLRDFELYPKYKENYIKSFDRMNEKLKQKNKTNFESGKEWFDWWVGNNPNQINLF